MSASCLQHSHELGIAAQVSIDSNFVSLPSEKLRIGHYEVIKSVIATQPIAGTPGRSTNSSSTSAIW